MWAILNSYLSLCRELFFFILFDYIEDLVVEQIVKNTVGCTDDNVTELDFAGILVGKVRRVLADGVLCVLQDLTQLHAFLDFTFLLEQLDMLFAGQD